MSFLITHFLGKIFGREAKVKQGGNTRVPLVPTNIYLIGTGVFLFIKRDEKSFRERVF